MNQALVSEFIKSKLHNLNPCGVHTSLNYQLIDGALGEKTGGATWPVALSL